MIVKYGDKEGYMDGYLSTNLELYKKMVKDKHDLIFVVVGREGFGKSTLAAEVLKYLDPTFDLDRCYMNGDDFIQALKDANEPFKAYLYDEGQEFTSRGAMTEFNKVLVQVLSRVRSKQLYVGICIPSFFELDKYPAIHRSNFLLEVYNHNAKRGFFKFWNWEKKKDLYILGKKFYNYNVVGANFIGRFTDSAFPFDKTAYNKKKETSMDGIGLTQRQEKTKIMKQRNELIRLIVSKNIFDSVGLSNYMKEKGFQLSRERISSVINENTKDVLEI